MSVEPIRRSVTVRCEPERTFGVFTQEIGAWWPELPIERFRAKAEEAA